MVPSKNATTIMKQCTLTNFKNNWKSGLTVGLVSIPVGVSLAVASNGSPISGIITAFWAGLLASIFGGSNYNIIGPTGALSGLLFTYTQQYGSECISMLALLSGIFIILGYIFKIDRYLSFVPGCALHGLISGIAIMIIFNQFGPALGINVPIKTHNMLIKLYHTIQHIDCISLPSFSLFCTVFIGLMLFALYLPRVPGTIILTPLCVGYGYLCANGILPYSIETLGSRYTIESMTLFALPNLHFSFFYILPALSIAAISILETLVSAKIADGITKTKHNRQREVLGLGLANIASGIAGGIPATAALARTSLNIRSGSTSRISATISVVSIALISLLCFKYFTYLPTACVAAILMFVSFRMIETSHFLSMFKLDKKSFVISVFVACITVCEDATIGVLLGAVIAMLIFMEKLSKGHHRVSVKPHLEEKDTLEYSIKGPLAYINAQAHIARLEQIATSCNHVVLNLHDVQFIDLDGVEAFSEMVVLLEQKNKVVFVSGLNPVIEHFLNESRIFKKLVRDSRIIRS